MPENNQRAWTSRAGAAKALKLAVFLTPILCAIALTRLIVTILPTPHGLLQIVGWWMAVLTTSICTGAVVDKEARKLLPVAALMSLSLVFPDEAPSRFKLALRRSSVRDLERRLKEDSLDPTSTPNDAAEILVEMASALNSHDRNTRGHTERVRAYSLMIGEELGLSPVQLNKLHWAALVHDVGKLHVPAEILNKPGKPDDDEWAILKQHPERGDEMVEPLRPWLGQFADATGQHHERWDGKGYPNGLRGANITLAARIVAVADAYDVMTSVRSYKTAMDTADARKEVTRCAGTQFDPRCARALITASLGEGVKTRQAVLWAIRTPILALTARSSLLSNGGTVVTSVAATAAAVAVAAPLVAPEEPLPFVEPVAVVQEIEVLPTIDRVDVIAGQVTIADLTINDQIGTTFQFGSPDLSVNLVEAPPGELSVSFTPEAVTVDASAASVGLFEVPHQVCANEISCEDSMLLVNVHDAGQLPAFLPGQHIRLQSGETYGPEMWPSHISAEEITAISVVPGDPIFFDGPASISPSGELEFRSSARTGLATLTVTAETASGNRYPAYVYVLIE